MEGEKVLCVRGYRRNAPEGGDGGAHGVRAAASHKPTLLHHARHPEIYGFALHEKSSGLLSPPRPAGSFYEIIQFTSFFIIVHNYRAVLFLGPPGPAPPVTG